jgi:hypothetical protein
VVVELIALVLLAEMRSFFLPIFNESSLTTIMVLFVSKVWLLNFDTLDTEEPTASAGVGKEAFDIAEDEVIVVVGVAEEISLKDERTTAA